MSKTKSFLNLLIVLSLFCAPMVKAGLFGESEEEKEARIAKHVAEVLREPNKVIAQAQDAVEKKDIEEGIRLFRKAQALLEAVEAKEDTSGSAFASLRLKKFHCISMLDALVLKQSEVMDVRQAVTDTSELAARLRQEREALAREAEKSENQNNLPRPPTLADQLAVEEGKLNVARAQLERLQMEQQKIRADEQRAQEAFAVAARLHTAADTKAFMADQAVKKAEKEGASKAVLAPLINDLTVAQKALDEAKAALQTAKTFRQSAMTAVEEMGKRVHASEEEVAQAQRSVDVLRKAMADEAEAKRKKIAAEKAKQEAEQQRLAAENLKKKQAEAEAAERARMQAEKVAIARDAAAKAKAETEAKALQSELQVCEELWRMKRIESFEKRIGEALVKWPESQELMVQLARLRLVQGQEEDALELVAMISNAGETGKQAAFVAAGAYMVKGMPLDAMKVLEPVMLANPKDPDVFYNMAVVLVRLPEVDPHREIAAKYYTKSIELGGRRSLVLERRLEME